MRDADSEMERPEASTWHWYLALDCELRPSAKLKRKKIGCPFRLSGGAPPPRQLHRNARRHGATARRDAKHRPRPAPARTATSTEVSPSPQKTHHP